MLDEVLGSRCRMTTTVSWSTLTGSFIPWRPGSDADLTGRKDHRRHLRLAPPTSGERVLQQGPVQGDRSAAYATRWVAKNIVAAGLYKGRDPSRLPH